MSFDGTRWESVGRDLTRPCSGAVDDFGSLECGLRGFDAGGAAIDYRYGGDFVAGREINAATLGGFPCGGGERSGIDAAFFDIEGRTALCRPALVRVQPGKRVRGS